MGECLVQSVKLFAHKRFALRLKFCSKEFEKTSVNGIKQFANRNVTVLVAAMLENLWIIL
jgi:hypothetical protein